MTTKATGSASTTQTVAYTLDARDRVTQIDATGANAGTSTFTWDANGNLLAKSSPAGTRSYAWNVRDRLIAKCETHANGRSPIVALTGAGAEYPHSDALGSSTLSTDGAGSAQATTTFDAFGNSITQGVTSPGYDMGRTGSKQLT